MLTAEPTGGVIWHACRGAITLRVRTHGREAHVGYVHQGINAFEHMIRIAQPLTALSHELLEKRTGFPVESEEAGGSMLVVGGEAGSGAGFNAVPGSAWFSVDRRFNPEEALDEELERLTDMIAEAAEAAGAEVDVDVLQRQPSGSTDQAHPAAQALARLRRRRRRRRPHLPAVSRRPRHALVLPARDPRLRLRWRAAGHLPWPRRVHRRGRHAPLRGRLRPIRRARHALTSGSRSARAGGRSGQVSGTTARRAAATTESTPG